MAVGYSLEDVAKLTGLSAGRIRGFVRAGLVGARCDARGAARFAFQDIVLLRTARGLLDARIPPRRVTVALERLRARLPRGRSLAGLKIAAAGDDVVVHDGGAVWRAASGQALFDFGFAVDDLAREVAPLARRAVREARTDPRVRAADWYELGCDLETSDPDQARDAYRRALELDPVHPDAHINLGRLLHAAGELEAAEAHYSLALSVRPDDVTAGFNLGVVLQDRGALRASAAAYERVLAVDPQHADAHFNLAGVCERLDDPQRALQHLSAYRRLTAGTDQ